MLIEILRDEKIHLVELLLNLYFQDYKEEFYGLFVLINLAVVFSFPLGGSFEMHTKFERIKNLFKKEDVEIFI